MLFSDKPFRFWCHKILPLVYDDSLTYYELLCKVVAYLNHMLEDVQTLAGDVDELQSMFVELKKYIDEYFDNLDVQDEINNKLDEMVEDGTLDRLLGAYVKNYTKMLMCVSTYRDDARTGSRDYCLAVSTDGGLTYSEIRASDDFANSGLGSDCSINKVADGYLFLATGANPQVGNDFNMAFTKDFETFVTDRPDYGFLDLAQEQCQDTYPMVGTPQIIESDGKYYLMLSVPTNTSTSGTNIYGYSETQRYMWLYACEVEFDSSNGFSMTKVGDIFALDIEDRTNVMDGHAVELDGKLYLFYKDRGDLTVHIAKADTILNQFEDVEKCVFEEVYLEACYMTKISETQALLTCTSYAGRQTTTLLGMFDAKAERVVYIGEPVRANCHHFYDGYGRGNSIDCGMRNPYPIVVDSDLYLILKEKYEIPVNTPSITKIPFQYSASPSNTMPQRASKYVYDTYGKYLRVFPWVYYYVGDDTDPLYILNDMDFLCGANLDVVINTPKTSNRHIRTALTGERFKLHDNAITDEATLYNHHYEVLSNGINFSVIQNPYNMTITFKGKLTDDLVMNETMVTKPSFIDNAFYGSIPVTDGAGTFYGTINMSSGSANIVYKGDTVPTDAWLCATATFVTR